MADGKLEIAPYGDLLKYAVWSLGALLVWIIVSLIPSVRANQVFFAWFNLSMLLCLLPAVLFMIGLGYFGLKSKYKAASACILGAIAICEIINVIPFNPFALALPFFWMCQSQNFAALGNFKAAEFCSRRLLTFWGPKSEAHSQWQLSALTCLTTSLQGQGRYPEASKVLESMFKIVESNDTGDELQALALTDFAGNLSSLGRAKEAIEIANKALKIWHSIPNLGNEQISMMSITMSQLGIAHECAGQYQQAL